MVSQLKSIEPVEDEREAVNLFRNRDRFNRPPLVVTFSCQFKVNLGSFFKGRETSLNGHKLCVLVMTCVGNSRRQFLPANEETLC